MDSIISAKQTLIAAAVKRVLRPLVRLMLANQLTYTFTLDLLKTLFVEVAEQDFSLDNKRQTDSRISIITGVHRKDVRRLRDYSPDVDEVIPENVSVGSQAIAIWTTDPRFLTEDGKPKSLMRFSIEAEDSFESLVRLVSKDIHPRAVLDEWLRLGVANLDEQNMVNLVADAFVPQEGIEEKAYFFGHNVHDHTQAAVLNLIDQQPAFFERCMHYDSLDAQDVAQLTEIAKKLGTKNLQEIYKATDALAKSEDKVTADASAANMRFSYGIYCYYEPMQAANKEKKHE